MNAADDYRGEIRGDITPALVALTERQAVELAELRERASRAESEAAALRDALAREAAQTAAERGARQTLEVSWRAAEAEVDQTRAELADLTAGGPFRRALRAFAFRRGRP